MTPPHSAIDISIKVIQWLNPLVYCVGFALGTWAYWLSRKLGYAFVAAYFLLALCSVFIAPTINRVMATRWDAQRKSELSPQAHEQFMKEYSALLQKYYPPGNTAPATLNLNVPLGPVVLVLGLWLLAIRESRTTAEPSAAPNGGPVASTGSSSAPEGRHR
jgi:hypothetical protein